MSGRGPRPRPVAGIDIGGTKIAVLIVDADGAVLGRATRPPPRATRTAPPRPSSAASTRRWPSPAWQREDLARGRRRGPRPGRPERRHGDPRRQPRLARLPAAGRASRQRLGRPVVVENDARAAAIGLYQRGVLGDLDDLAYLAVGTGIAAGRRPRRHASIAVRAAWPARSATPSPTATARPAPAASAAASRPSRRVRPSLAARSRAPARKPSTRAAVAGDPAARDLDRRASAAALAWAVHLLVMTYDVERVVHRRRRVACRRRLRRAPPPRARAAARRVPDWPASCCRPTSSRSCRPRRRPVPGVPWPSPARPARPRTAPTSQSAGEEVVRHA